MTDPAVLAYAVHWVAGIGLLGTGPLTGTVLAGGVSCDVVAVSGPGGRVVVKHAGPFLRVADQWAAPLRRVLHEGDVLRALATLTPGSVPAVLAVDRTGHRIAMAHAPTSWATWKAALLAEHADAAVGAQLGRTLGTWHAATWRRPEYGRLDDPELFRTLRLDPYLRTCQRRRPEHAAALGAVLARLEARRDCLVHGDFSPKNLLLGDDGLWVLDPELCALTGALLLARVDGASPAEYLDARGRARVSWLADRVLDGPVEELGALWRTADEVCA